MELNNKTSITILFFLIISPHDYIANNHFAIRSNHVINIVLTPYAEQHILLCEMGVPLAPTQSYYYLFSFFHNEIQNHKRYYNRYTNENDDPTSIFFDE